jgi:hypothetical protein
MLQKEKPLRWLVADPTPYNASDLDFTNKGFAIQDPVSGTQGPSKLIVWGTPGELRYSILPETGGGICGSPSYGLEHIAPLLYLNRFLGRL